MADKITPTLEIRTITPEMAKELLAMNTNNFRRLDRRTVERYANDILLGNWHLTGDTIKVYNGTLVDGQHRLAAIIKANRPIRTAFASGFTSESLHIDKGKPRTIHQWMHNDGHKNVNTLVGTVKLVLQYIEGDWQIKKPFVGYSDEQIIEYADDYRLSLENSVKLGKRCRSIVASSIASTIIHIGSGRIDDPREDKFISWFWEGVIEGASLDKGDPPFVLRTKLLKDKALRKSTIDPYFERILTNMAWNKAVLGKTITPAGLRVRLTGPAKQTPPAEIMLSPDFDTKNESED